MRVVDEPLIFNSSLLSMENSLIYGLCFTLLGIAPGCDKNSALAGPLTCSFQLLNEQGQEATVFSQGQNLIFRFQVTNTCDQNIYIKIPMFNTQDFLEVYGTAGKQNVSLGKPYSGIFCNYVSGYTLVAHQAMTFTIPWVDVAAFPISFPFCTHAPTTYLPTGHYRTSFSPSVTWHFQSQEPAATTTTDFQPLTREFDVK
jgi:hypothetical protein